MSTNETEIIQVGVRLLLAVLTFILAGVIFSKTNTKK